MGREIRTFSVQEDNAKRLNKMDKGRVSPFLNTLISKYFAAQEDDDVRLWHDKAELAKMITTFNDKWKTEGVVALLSFEDKRPKGEVVG